MGDNAFPAPECPSVMIEGVGRCFYRLFGFIDAKGEWAEGDGVPPNAELLSMFVATPTFKIGRRNDAITNAWAATEALLIDNPKVSRHHATIELSPDRRSFLIRCLSKNGCDVNGVNIRANETAPLMSGTKIRIGPMYCQFLLPRE